jgi:predicted lipid-binding transport protein (Tim44 family)
MLFGATNAPAATHEATGDPSRQEDGNASGTSGPSATLLLMLIAVAAAGLYYFYKRRNDRLSPAFPAAVSTRSGARSEPPAWVPTSLGLLSPSSSEPNLTAADEVEFRHRLIEIQTAWGRQDVQALRRLATPEVSQHFSHTLADNLSQGIENRIEDVVIMHAEVRDAWAEGARVYATVLFQWKARDYVLSLSNPSGDAESSQEWRDGSVVKHSEAWTFVKHGDGKWLLSAVQQVE